jgi:hypothetical protein
MVSKDRWAGAGVSDNPHEPLLLPHVHGQMVCSVNRESFMLDAIPQATLAINRCNSRALV